MKTANQLLHQLLDQYENSVVSKEGSKRQLKQRIQFTAKLLSKYFASDGYRYKMSLHEDLFVMQQKGWIEIDYDSDFDEIKYITLKYDYLDEMYRFLKRMSRQHKEQAYLELFHKFDDAILAPYVNDVTQRILSFQSYKSLVYDELDKTKDLLLSLKALLLQKEEVLERIFSVRILNDSKAFTTLKPKLAMILKTYYGADEQSDVDTLMAEYNVLKNPSHLLLKGSGILQIGQTMIHLSDFKEGLSLSSSDVEQLVIHSIDAKQIVSIENLTSFYTAKEKDCLFVYLGGFHNQVRRSLFIKLNQACQLPFYHFGDIDAGGMLIYHHLCEKTNIAFQPLLMDIQTLQTYQHATLPLTSEDQKRLQDLLKKETCFKEVIEWMLVHQVKLEQEHVEFKMR